MKRDILCPGCGPRYLKGLPAEDFAMGFKQRVVRVVAKRPEGHGISVITESTTTREETPLRCDLCGANIPDGEIVHARTVWNTNREGTPGNWEKDFGTVISDDAAKVAEELSKPSE